MPPVSTTPAAKFSTIFPSVVDTGGKFATGVNDSGGKFAADVNDASGKLPPVLMTLGKRVARITPPPPHVGDAQKWYHAMDMPIA